MSPFLVAINFYDASAGAASLAGELRHLCWRREYICLFYQKSHFCIYLHVAQRNIVDFIEYMFLWREQLACLMRRSIVILQGKARQGPWQKHSPDANVGYRQAPDNGQGRNRHSIK
ncbi:MAG: hypothetical protein QM776_05725 [Rhodocyclaceae bacterium]